MKIELPKKVLFIINNLQLAGYDAFAVGGCVRDSILARNRRTGISHVGKTRSNQGNISPDG